MDSMGESLSVVLCQLLPRRYKIIIESSRQRLRIWFPKAHLLINRREHVIWLHYGEFDIGCHHTYDISDPDLLDYLVCDIRLLCEWSEPIENGDGLNWTYLRVN